jgi:hypothetical protein
MQNPTTLDNLNKYIKYLSVNTRLKTEERAGMISLTAFLIYVINKF